MREEYDEFSTPGVQKVEVDNDEFGLKHRMVRDEPQQAFLLYMPYPRPIQIENWFLDLELSHHVFYADGISIVLQEMGWQEEHRTFVEEHRDFFKNQDRKNRLLEKLHKEDSERDWRLKMLSVLCREEPTLEACLLALLSEQSEGKDERVQAIAKYKLDWFFWDAVARQYGYRSESPTVLDFAIEALLSAAPCGKTVTLGQEAKVFVKRWQDSNRYRGVFEDFAGRMESELNIKNQLQSIDGYAELLDWDVFEAIDRKVIVELRDDIIAGRISFEEMRDIVERRESLFWYPKYADVYASLMAAKKLTESIQNLDLAFDTIEEGIQRYTQTYWQIDQLYRHFHFHLTRSRQATLLDSIKDEVELRYANDYLLRVCDRFQQSFEVKSNWPPDGSNYQREFYRKQVTPHLAKGNKLFVIISDALRYEIGEELHQRILRENRFRSKLSYHIGVLPSYTQLGMAALLPNKKVEIDPANAEVKVDGQRAAGLEGRKTILLQNNSKATALKAQDFLQMNAKEEGRALLRDHDLIYIYQNGIDQVGDKRETEAEVFTAANKEMDTLIDVLKKISAVNGNNAIITADHGFLFRNRDPEESDFTETPKGNPMGVVNRRFAIGSMLDAPSGTHLQKAHEIGLEGDYEVGFPKSINLYRKQGAGARYVHGGSSMQELVLPVLTVNKARKDDTEVVEVDVIRSGSNMITSSQARITFYQEEPAVDKRLAQKLRVGFYSKAGELLSDVKDLVFDATEQEPRLRERKVQFSFSKLADKKEYQNTDIFLRLQKKIANSNHYSDYKTVTYRLKKAFESDFEL